MLAITLLILVVNRFCHNDAMEVYIQSKTCYILAQELGDFKCWAIKIPHFNTDHCTIITEICLSKFYIHHCYTCCQQNLPPFPLQQPLLENDVRFQHLKEYKESPDP